MTGCYHQVGSERILILAFGKLHLVGVMQKQRPLQGQPGFRSFADQVAEVRGVRSIAFVAAQRENSLIERGLKGRFPQGKRPSRVATGTRRRQTGLTCNRSRIWRRK